MNDHANEPEDWEAEVPQGSIWMHRMTGREIFVCGHSWAADNLEPMLMVLYKDTVGPGNISIPETLERELFQHRFKRLRPTPEKSPYFGILER